MIDRGNGLSIGLTRTLHRYRGLAGIVLVEIIPQPGPRPHGLIDVEKKLAATFGGDHDVELVGFWIVIRFEHALIAPDGADPGDDLERIHEEIPLERPFQKFGQPLRERQT
jgi:hypothetical protein